MQAGLGRVASARGVAVAEGVGISREAVECLAGTWNASLLYRRAAMCLWDHVYRDVQQWVPGFIYSCPALLTQEFLILGVLAPFLRANVRAKPHDELHYSYASLTKGSTCSAPIKHHVAQQLHYWSDIRGKHSYLHTQAVALKNKLK